MAKISVQQRKYFVERIENSINEKINILKQQRAADVQQISESEYKRYLKTIKLDKTLSRYKKVKDEFDLLGGRITAVYDEILESMGKRRYDSQVPSIYNGSSYSDIDKAFRYVCNKTAQGQETETESGKMIKELESKKRAACDVLHGINDLEELTGQVNAILKGSDVPMLGA
tara:strand:- start:14933 stop:15448 length:516 start_codon:yes stop_codon:yes gene_type:complete